MDPFILIIWLWMGQRFEETRIENLLRSECVERAVAIEADRWQKWIACIDARGRIVFPGERLIPELRTFPPCANAACGWPLPGRRRV
jgi:hypothetical protein